MKLTIEHESDHGKIVLTKTDPLAKWNVELPNGQHLMRKGGREQVIEHCERLLGSPRETD